MGLAADEVRFLALAWLERRLLPVVPDELDAYWQSGLELARLRYQSKVAAAFDRVRDQLDRLFGETARQDPALKRVFEPLHARQGYLDSAGQLALQRFQLEQQLVRAERPGNARRRVAGGAEQPDYDSLVDQLGGAIGAVQAAEFLYRDTPLAAELRAANLGLSEQEFRAVFSQLLALERAPADAGSFGRVRAELRTMLGKRRFNELWSSRDPLYAVIAGVGREQGLSNDRIQSAYAVINESQDDFAAAVLRFAADPERVGTELRFVRARLESDLSGLVGAEVARELLTAQEQSRLGAR
jgi:hypothetical protein